MTALKIQKFEGIEPRTPASLLPPFAATIAKNCDFAYGELRNTKGDFLIQGMTNVPQTIYTDDGLLFFTWTFDVSPVRSPLANDQFNRLYYTTGSDFRVASRSAMSIGGGAPPSNYRVGVPRPTLLPAMTVPATADLTAVTITAQFHYEYAGVKYQEGVITLTSVDAKKKFTCTPPTKTIAVGAAEPATPTQAFPVIRLTGKDQVTQDVVFDIYSANSGMASDGAWIVTLSRAADKVTYSVELASSAKDEDKQTRAYVYTYVNTYGEEGPPSGAGTITALGDLRVSVSVVKDIQTADYAPIKEIRLYRTPTGSEIADYFYVGSVNVLSSAGPFVFVDTVKASGLNEPIASTNYYPPALAMGGLIQLPNGILCAWKDNELHFSDAYKPWSWPPAYVKTFPNAIVSGIAHGAGALITTLGQPFLISGVSPDTMTETKLKIPQAGVSKWSIADVDGMIVYASNDGIVAVEGGMAKMGYSEKFFTRDVWRGLYRGGFGTMRFAVWDGRLIVYSSTNQFVAFMIRLDEARGSMTELPNFLAKCTFVSPLTDQCYLANGSLLYQFAGGADITATWQSKEIVLNAPNNFGFAQAILTGNWTIKFYCTNSAGAYVLRHTKLLSASADFRLPAGFRSDRWKINLIGVGSFRELRLANSPRELAAL